jgi:glutamyl-tRNA synthetase
MSKIVTRFAPSPTGYIHVGNIRAALFPYLLAAQAGGTMILRIEDTDQARFVEGATDLIVDSLRWLGIEWNEGYLAGGGHGPYEQSQRKEIYLKYAHQLIQNGQAYADPYTAQQVEEFRQDAINQKRPFLYRNYRPKNPPQWDGTQPLRLKVDPKPTKWHDPIMGELSAGPEAQDDFILIKSDGLPTYNFAHIVDDYEMKVTHVIRGLEYISSIPKYLSLYQALGIVPPVLACMPHILAPEGNKKLGKRDGAKSVTEYREQGILPEAMLNFLALLGWNDGTDQEIYTKKELIEKFSLEKVQKSGARFDEKKLVWMNGQWIRSLSLDELYDRVETYWPESSKKYSTEYKKAVLGIAQDRMKTLSDLSALTKFFFEEPIVEPTLISTNKQLSKLSNSQLGIILKRVIEDFNQIEDFSPTNIQETLNNLLNSLNQKPIILFSIVRIATTWAEYSPELPASLAILGKEITIERLKNSLVYLEK